MLNKVAQDGTSSIPQQVECTPKRVEFEQIMVSPTNSSISDRPMVVKESDEEEILTQEAQYQQELIAVNSQDEKFKNLLVLPTWWPMYFQLLMMFHPSFLKQFEVQKMVDRKMLWNKRCNLFRRTRRES